MFFFLSGLVIRKICFTIHEISHSWTEKWGFSFFTDRPKNDKARLFGHFTLVIGFLASILGFSISGNLVTQYLRWMSNELLYLDSEAAALIAISSFGSRVTKCRWSRVWSLWPPQSHICGPNYFELEISPYKFVS